MGVLSHFSKQEPFSDRATEYPEKLALPGAKRYQQAQNQSKFHYFVNFVYIRRLIDTTS